MFLQLIDADTRLKIANWTTLKRWERREVGQTLRRLGLCYREISQIVPVAKGTLSGWCRDLDLTEEQKARIRALRPEQARRNGVGNVLRQRAIERAEAIRRSARAEASRLIADPGWVAGVVAYWAEGKKSNELVFANSDPAMIKLFIDWAQRYLELSPDRFNARLHLHTGQDEKERREFWSGITGIPSDGFRKGFIKPEGTGHRKKVLYNGTIQIRVSRSGDLLHRVSGWIDAIPLLYGDAK
jgi:hypothetical protein